MSEFDELKKKVEAGLEGKNSGVPMGFNKLNRYIGIRRNIMTLVFGASGSGKSAYLHSAYILNPYDYLYSHPEVKMKFKVILFSMERSKIYILAKWISRKIFIDYGILIPISRMLGWWGEKLSKDEHDLFLAYEDYINKLLETVSIIEGAQNPTGIYKYVKEYAAENGKVEHIDEFNKVYIPDDPNEIVVVAEDHTGIVKIEKGYATRKEAIDKLSEYNQIFRDFYGYTPVVLSQLNRNLNNPIYRKLEDVEPTIDDVKESGNPGEASDVVVSLFDPRRYNTTHPIYDVDKFVDHTTGGNYFRSVKILKNSYGEDSIRVGMGFMGSTGMFKELPNKEHMENFDYNSLFDGQFFL